MSQQVVLKVYGHIWPVTAEFVGQLGQCLRDAMPTNDDVPLLCHEGDMARISFEGIHFPVDEVLELVRGQLDASQRGKLDVLDMENWRMQRHVFEAGQIRSSAAPLNHVMDFAGL